MKVGNDWYKPCSEFWEPQARPKQCSEGCKNCQGGGVTKLRDREKILTIISVWDEALERDTIWSGLRKVFILNESQQQPSHKSIQKKLSINHRCNDWKRKQRTVISSASPLWERHNILHIFNQGWETIKLLWIFMLIFNSWEGFCGDKGQCDVGLQAYWLENEWKNKVQVMNYSYRSILKNGKPEERALWYLKEAKWTKEIRDLPKLALYSWGQLSLLSHEHSKNKAALYWKSDKVTTCIIIMKCSNIPPKSSP